MRIHAILFTMFLLQSIMGTSLRAQDATDISASDVAFFEARIRPVLVEHCYECHSEETDDSGDLLLDTRAAMLRGGVSGPAIVPGNAKRSLLLAAVKHSDPDLEMPPSDSGEKLPDTVIADLERWIEMGAPDPRDGEHSKQETYNSESAKAWWAYQPLKSPDVPETSDADWPLTDIDRFVLANLEQNAIHPVEVADRASLLRRVFMDLIGLPPPLEIQDKFLASDDPKALEQVVDWLLDQPQFGERWGRHWLDVARFAETTGRDLNLTMPEAWRYRDYVIEAFNADKPFNEFIMVQIAGDLLPASTESARVQNLIATGFLAVGPKGLNESDPRQFAVDLADEQIDAVSQAFLGMTISCARCHDHKFDPITQVDYTAVAGIFLSTQTHYGTPGGVRARNASDLIPVSEDVGLSTPRRPIDPEVYSQNKQQLDAISRRLDDALRSRAPQQRGGNSGQMRQSNDQVSGFDIVRMMTRSRQLEVEIAAYHPDGTAKPLVMGVSDKPDRVPSGTRGRRVVGGPNTRGRTDSGFETIADSPLLLRGSIENETDRVPRGVPEFLSHGARLDIPRDSSGRLQLAQWIASPENTLTSRVIVNRVWYWLFGRGLVESVDNFGASGTLPSNQELLDHLAAKFVREGWSIKRLIREIVTSRVYQLDSRYDEANFSIDPDNRLFWRSNTRRMDAESIRDCMLYASGELELAPVSGSMVASAGDGPVGGDRFQALGEDTIARASGNFRSIYLPVARSVQPESLATFDFTDPSMVLGSRNTTIVPPQALYLMNGEFVDTQARAMAARVMQEDRFEDRFSLACRLTYCREPYPNELAAAKRSGGDDLAGWTSICRALLSSADFLFVN